MSTTITPAETGTTYPIPPAPSWASGEPIDDQDAIDYETVVGTVDAVEGEPISVILVRRDWL